VLDRDISEAGGMAVNVVLIDGQALVLDGLLYILQKEPDILVAGMGSDADAAVALAKDHQPDVLILDAEMPGSAPQDIIKQVLDESPSTRVVILASNGDPLLANSLIASTPQVRAYLVKDISSAQLVDTVRTVMQEARTVVASSVRSLNEALQRLTPTKERNGPALSAREHEVLLLAARGLTNQGIADQLFIAEGTVRNHLSAVYNKLSASNRVDAINRAIRSGLISVQDPDA
jgi:DNA-binding NarL/FixJ family response regulator